MAIGSSSGPDITVAPVAVLATHSSMALAAQTPSWSQVAAELHLTQLISQRPPVQGQSALELWRTMTATLIWKVRQDSGLTTMTRSDFQGVSRTCGPNITAEELMDSDLSFTTGCLCDLKRVS